VADTLTHLPDWITAISTAVTATAAIAAGFIAWVSLRRQSMPALPVIEPDFQWLQSQSKRFLRLNIVVRNQLYETIIIERITIKNPRGMTFATETQRNISGPKTFGPNAGKIPLVWRENFYEKHETVEVALDWSISPVGTVSSVPYPEPEMARRDVHSRTFFLAPPSHWNEGTVRIELQLVSKALTIRRRRITIKRNVNTAPMTSQPEEKADP
jgi:hypothetical protein